MYFFYYAVFFGNVAISLATMCLSVKQRSPQRAGPVPACKSRRPVIASSGAIAAPALTAKSCGEFAVANGIH